MTSQQKYDFDELLKKARELIASEKVRNFSELGRKLGISKSTLRDGFSRNFKILTWDDITPRIDKDGATNLIGTEAQDKIEIEIEGNYGRAISVNRKGQIQTIEQFVDAANLDMEEWDIVNPRVKKWDVVLKLRNSDVDVVEIIPSFYIDLPLQKKHPVAFEPIIHPLHIEIPKVQKPRKPGKNEVRRALLMGDAQMGFRRTLHTSELVPFHDRTVMDIALQIAQEEKIDHISFAGDMLDLSEWSNKFQPEPEFFWTTQPALIELAWWMLQFRTAQPEAEMQLHEGNHDVRMPNLIVANLRQAYKLKAVDELQLPSALSLARLLALHSMRIDYIDHYPNNGTWLNNKTFITHGDVVRGGSGDTAKAIAQRRAHTTIFFHVHRREMVGYKTLGERGEEKIHDAFCPGALCHIDGRVPGSKGSQQWQNGFAVIEYTENEQNIIPIAVNNGQAIYNGIVWKGNDRDKEVNSMLASKLEEITDL